MAGYDSLRREGRRIPGDKALLDGSHYAVAGISGHRNRTVLELLRKPGTLKAKPVILQNGYGRDAPQVEVMCTLSIGTGKEEWGAEAGKEYYKFHIKNISGKE